MSATSVLEPTLLDFRVSEATIAKLTPSSNIFTFSGAGGSTVELKGITNPTQSNSAATKNYVDSVANGLHWLTSVRTASTANITLATGAANNSVIDTITLATGNRILLKNQTVATANGVYIVQATGAPSRASDLSSGDSAASHAVFVQEGSSNADQAYTCTSDTGSDVVGTNNLSWTQFTGLGQVTAGEALSKTANTIDVNVDDSSLEVASDALQVKALGITNAMLAGSIANAKLSNSAVTVTAGDGLQTGGSVSLGSTVTVDVDATVIRTTGGQTIAGTETFSGAVSLSGTTSNSGLVEFANTAAPATTTNKLYSVGGNLTWAGTKLNQTSYTNAGTTNKVAFYSDANNVDDAVGITVSTTNSTNDTLTVYKIVGTNGDYSGNFEVDGNLDVPTDTGSLRLGASNDLTLSHNGTYSQVYNATGELLIHNAATASDVVLKLGDANAATAFKVKGSSASTVLEMDSAGAGTVSGSWTVDNIKMDGATIGHTSDTDLLTLASGQLTVAGNVDVTNGVDVSGAALTTSSGITNTAGDVSVTGGALKLSDDIYLYAGSDNDFSLVHDSSNLSLTNTVGNFNLRSSGTTSHIVAKVGSATTATSFKVTDSADAAAFVVKGDKSAQHKGLLTTEAGHTHSGGELLVSGGNVQLNDNIALTVGTGNDLSISHNGTDTTFASGTGHLVLNNSVTTKDVQVKLGALTNAVGFKVKDSAGSDLLKVDGTGAAVVSDTLNVNSTTDATSASTGSLKISGGIGVSKQIYSDSQMYATKYNTHSDRRLKTNIKNVTESEANKLSQIEPKYFYWKDVKRGSKRQCGFIAQEVQEIMPENVEESNGYLSVNYQAIVPLLLKKIQMLEAKVEKLSKQAETKNGDIRYNAY